MSLYELEEGCVGVCGCGRVGCVSEGEFDRVCCWLGVGKGECMHVG